LQDGAHFALPFVRGPTNNFLAAGLSAGEQENDFREVSLLIHAIYLPTLSA
jgi:hypothetical protein